MSADLTTAEQAHVRAAARFLRSRMGGWKNAAKALRVSPSTVRQGASPTLALRIARLVGVGVDDVLGGKYPPAGVCPHCGNPASTTERDLV